MVQCSKCTFRTKYPGGKMCWDLDKPLCGDCAYALDQELEKKMVKLAKNKVIKSLIKKEIQPILLAYNQRTAFKLYEKTYIRKPSTKGGRLSQKNSNNTSLCVS